MRLLIAADIFPPQSGGPATYVVNLSNALTKEGWNVRIVTHNTEADKKKVDCKVYPVWFKNKLLRYINYFILLFVHSFGVDVIYAMGPVNAGWPALFISKLLRKKFVLKVVGDYAWEQGQISGVIKDSIDDFQKNKHGGKIERLQKREHSVVRHADLIIVPSEYLKRVVLGWGAKNSKIEVIYNTVEFKRVDPIIHNGERWIVSVARLVPWKGMSMLIDLILDLKDVQLKIVGDGPEMKNLELKIKELQLENRVELLGNLPKDKTLSYIASADWFILNSGYEGLPHVLLEAQMLNRPILASNVGGNPEVVVPELYTVLFKFNDKEDLKRKMDLLKKNITDERKESDFWRKFSAENMFNQTKKVLQSVCAN